MQVKCMGLDMEVLGVALIESAPIPLIWSTVLHQSITGLKERELITAQWPLHPDLV
jgi:hypothetical protein